MEDSRFTLVGRQLTLEAKKRARKTRNENYLMRKQEEKEEEEKDVREGRR